MKNSSKVDEYRKSKDDQLVAVISSLEEIHRVVDANQQRLRNLEVAIVNLTTICCAIKNDVHPLGPSHNQGSMAKVGEMKRRSSLTRTSLELKSDVLGAQMQQLVEQAAALGLLKDSKTSSIKLSGNVKTIPRRPGPRKVQATTNQKTSTKSSQVKSMESTTEKKLSKKQVKKRIGSIQPGTKNPPERNSNGDNTKASARISLKSTVKNTKTTISKVAVNQSAPNKSRKITAKNVEKIQSKDSIKVTRQTKVSNIVYY